MRILYGGLGILCLYAFTIGATTGPILILPWTAAFALSLTNLIAWIVERRTQRKPLLAAPAHRPLFWMCLTLYLATFRWHGGDDIPNSVLPWLILKHGTLSLEPWRAWFLVENTLRDFTVEPSGTLLSIFSIIPGLIAFPVSVPAVLSGGSPTDLLLHNLSKVSGALITAISVPIFYDALRKQASERWAATLALAYGLGGWSFSISSQALHSHAPAQLGAVLGFWGLFSKGNKAAALAGFGFSLAVACREDSFFFAAAGGLYYLFHRRKEVIAFSCGAAIPLLINICYWLWYTGLLKPPYMGAQTSLFSGFQPEAFAAMLISPTRGVFWFSPIFLFGFWAMARGIRDSQRRWIPYFAAASFILMVFISFRYTWAAGQTFGNRYYMIMLMALLAMLAGDEKKFSHQPGWSTALGASIMVHALGAFFLYPGSYAAEQQLAEVWTLSLHPALDLFRVDGSLGSFGAFRFLVGGVILGTAIPITLWNRNFLSDR
ncbi:MAG: hypothetical protein COB53_02650 [Elusimicrobia bacterium]|nr:MAG: hypothetical protein COB53_02650 [Elusimicrobiota bacterium]